MCVCVCVCVQTEEKPALVLAAEGGHVECVKLLMSHEGIDKNATYGENQLCALHRYTPHWGHTGATLGLTMQAIPWGLSLIRLSHDSH